MYSTCKDLLAEFPIQLQRVKLRGHAGPNEIPCTPKNITILKKNFLNVHVIAEVKMELLFGSYLGIYQQQQKKKPAIGCLIRYYEKANPKTILYLAK